MKWIVLAFLIGCSSSDSSSDSSFRLPPSDDAGVESDASDAEVADACAPETPPRTCLEYAVKNTGAPSGLIQYATSCDEPAGACVLYSIDPNDPRTWAWCCLP